ncbi:hypothetical protein Acid345_4587 [Candidatus Koribacter versatilis Ellin345]|uniref:DUF1440 domain-containing protein n=1 Tax=Koribacter versatilis (strain Ellin345) TaxID=204669 RepID=Q1IHR3_KORVE|nr:hypothetical protein [Candidatus Koribacter versatilis]ABF43587.1 hypothetical protein Acid345_4587 [Candidatus Koribacter versatilis Ellin345]
MNQSPGPGPARVLRTILTAGIVAAILDGSGVSLFYFLKGFPPLRLWQGVASSLLGKDAFLEGWRSGMFGIFLHLCVATTVATIFVLLARRIPFLIRHYVWSGLVYGIGVFLVMNRIVVPLTRVQRRPMAMEGLIVQLVLHLFAIGLSIAFVTRTLLKSSTADA